MNIFGFAFGSGNVSAWTLWRLKYISCCYQVFPSNLEHYLEMLLHDQPKYIVGLGVYTGRDQDKIRIETTCTNQFRNNSIEENTIQEIEINYFLKPSVYSKYATAIGNSYCNLVSWNIMRLIEKKQLVSRYTFLHIPKTMKTIVSVREIDQLISQFTLEIEDVVSSTGG